ncbi:hypothetical protein TNCV_1699271 [Trichonephila clavipes]|nr:hypothetical protein TNCV_1699271 [Trichonephila clavipes]
MTLRLIAKGHSPMSCGYKSMIGIRFKGAHLNIFKCVLGTRHTNGTDLEDVRNGLGALQGDRYYSRPGVATDIASEKHDHRMMMREHFGQQLHNTFFSVGVEVNDLGGCKPLTMIRKCVINTSEKEEVTFHWLPAFRRSRKCFPTLGMSPAFRLERSRKWLLMGFMLPRYQRKQTHR